MAFDSARSIRELNVCFYKPHRAAEIRFCPKWDEDAASPN